VSPRGPLRLGRNTQLQPDLALLRPPRDAYRKTVPASADVLLVIEVADTSLERDRAIKLPRYATLDIREVWIVDIEGQAVEVYRAPTPSGYRDAQRVALDGHVSPAAFADLRVSVAEILG
jgi:Uma2 family endonuclease